MLFCLFIRLHQRLISDGNEEKCMPVAVPSLSYNLFEDPKAAHSLPLLFCFSEAEERGCVSFSLYVGFSTVQYSREKSFMKYHLQREKRLAYQNIKIQDTVAHESLVQIKKAQKYACVFYQPQVFKQNITTQKSFHSNPHTTYQFEKKTIMRVQALLHRNCKYAISCLTLQRLWPPVFFPFCTAGRPVMAQREKIYSGTCKLNVFEIYEKCLPTLTTY